LASSFFFDRIWKDSRLLPLIEFNRGRRCRGSALFLLPSSQGGGSRQPIDRAPVNFSPPPRQPRPGADVEGFFCVPFPFLHGAESEFTKKLFGLSPLPFVKGTDVGGPI